MGKAKLNFKINTDAIKKRLDGSSKSKNKISYFKPSAKNQSIRLVPFTEGNDLGIAVEDGVPIIEVRQHYPLKDYFVGKFKKIVSPMSFGKPDPIITMYYELRTQNADNLEDEGVKSFLQPLEGKSRYYSFILHETSAGNELKLWSYPYGTFKQLMTFLSDPDEHGDILDPNEGHFVNVVMDNRNITTVSLKPKITPLTEDDIDLILAQPSLENQFQYETEDELQRILSAYLEEDVADTEEEELEDDEVEEVEEESTDEVEEVEEEKPKPKKVVTKVETKTEETSNEIPKKTEFAKLFNKKKNN